MDNIDPPPKELHIISYNLKNFDTHLIVQELGAFKQTDLKKYMSFSISSKLIVFQVLH